MPGNRDFALMTPSWRANPLTLSLRRSSRSPPDLQYLATVFRSMPYLLAISLKFGVVPDWRYMFSSPIRFLSIRAPIVGLALMEAYPSSRRWGGG